PCLAVTRMAGELPAPQKRHRIVHPPARRPAVHIGCEGLSEQPQRRRRVAGLEMSECEMPTEVTIEQAVARISGQPGCEEAARCVWIAVLIAEMCAGVRRPGVVRVLREGPVDHWAGGITLSILRQRHAK